MSENFGEPAVCQFVVPRLPSAFMADTRESSPASMFPFATAFSHSLRASGLPLDELRFTEDVRLGTSDTRDESIDDLRSVLEEVDVFRRDAVDCLRS